MNLFCELFFDFWNCWKITCYACPKSWNFWFSSYSKTKGVTKTICPCDFTFLIKQLIRVARTFNTKLYSSNLYLVSEFWLLSLNFYFILHFIFLFQISLSISFFFDSLNFVICFLSNRKCNLLCIRNECVWIIWRLLTSISNSFASWHSITDIRPIELLLISLLSWWRRFSRILLHCVFILLSNFFNLP